MSLVRDILTSIEKYIDSQQSIRFEGINAKAPTGEVTPGDIELIDIVLMSEDGNRQYSLIAQAKGIDIYESILSPCIFAEIGIQDTTNLLENFPILGEEIVKITFRTPGNSTDPVSYMFRVNAVINKTIDENNNMSRYVLQLITNELLTNSNRKISKKVSGNVSTAIKEIVEEDLQSEKAIRVDQTKGIERILLTGMEPLKAIDYLRLRALSPKYVSSSFVFYENKNGYNFTTIERLIETGKQIVESGNHDKIFFFDTVRKDSDQNVTYRNIIAYNQLAAGDKLSQVAKGGLNNDIQEFDLITGNIRKVTYTDNVGADKFVTMSKNSASPHTTNFVRKHGPSTSVTRIVPTTSDKPQLDISEKISILTAYAQKIAQNLVQIHIYGDSDITVGDMIQCNFPSGEDSTAGIGSRLSSGNYLVAKVRHMILNTDRPQYTMALELIKSELEENV